MSSDIVKNDSLFNYEIKCLLEGQINAFAVSGNSYIRRKVYEYCEENDLKYTRSIGKVPLVICTEHKCVCKKYKNSPWCNHVYGDGTACIHCNYYCPHHQPNPDDDGCSIELCRPKQPIIYIYQKDYTLDQLNAMNIKAWSIG
jgi:hypothetical protein